MANKSKPESLRPANNALCITQIRDEDPILAAARSILDPEFRHAVTVSQVLNAQFGKIEGAPGLGDYASIIGAKGDAAAKGELAFASRALAAQALTLDTIFAEMARRMACNMGEHLAATEIYARIALKAQAQSRSTLESLAKLHQPREQTVRHVHVSEGGQAIVADQFHHHGGGTRNAQSAEQPHAAGAAADTGERPALPCADALRDAVSVASGARPEAVPDARRD